MRAQSFLHPVCAQQPEGSMGYDVGGTTQQVACHTVARACNNNPECRDRLERFNQACSVDANTKSCSGAPEACRRGMIDILGTELRINCGCEGTAADFRELYDCIGWHRSLWVNPCVGKYSIEFINKNFRFGWVPWLRRRALELESCEAFELESF